MPFNLFFLRSTPMFCSSLVPYGYTVQLADADPVQSSHLNASPDSIFASEL
jgi:hypothetical protein